LGEKKNVARSLTSPGGKARGGRLSRKTGDLSKYIPKKTAV